MSAVGSDRRKFDMRITFGNIITIAMIILGAVVGYATMKSENTTTRDKLEVHISSQDQYVLKAVQDTRDKFIDEKLDNIQKSIDEGNKKIDTLILQAKYAR